MAQQFGIYKTTFASVLFSPSWFSTLSNT